MKLRKAFSAFLAIAMLLSTFTGCDTDKPFKYEFRQDRNNVEKIEICAYDHYAGTRDCLVELSESEINELWEDILSLECFEFVMLDPILDYGDVVIFIYYLDGETEMIGITNIGWITPDGDDNITRMRFGIEDICTVIAKYVDPEILADVSAYFPRPNQ